MPSTATAQTAIIFNFDNRDSYSAIFKKLYFHLYSNGNASRAEAIIEDLAKVLLIKIVTSKHNLTSLIDEYLSQEANANEYLVPIIQKHISSFYQDDPFQLDDKSIRRCFLELDQVNFDGAHSHVLGDAFQALVGPILRGDKGQFFTPKSIVRAMVEIANPKSTDKIIDPACGTGGFLIESLNYINSHGGTFEGTLVGIDKDKFLSKTTQLICEIYTPKHHTILNSNSLDIDKILKDKDVDIFNADVVLTNPPFGAKIGITEEAILKQYSFGYNWVYVPSEGRWIQTKQLLNSQDPQILFIELCVKLLKEGGFMGIILPEGIYGNRNSGYIWDYLKGNGEIVGMIDCPRTAFQPSTDVKTNILFYKKSKTLNTQKNLQTSTSFKVAIATNCGHDKRGRLFTENGKPYPDDFPSIARDFRLPSPNMWTKAVVKDQYYLVPRYCDSSIEGSLHREFKGDFLTVEQLIKQNFISIRKGDEVGSEAYGTGDIPFIRTSDITNLEITSDPTKSVSEEIYEKYKSVQNIQEGDILLVADGRYRIGRTAIIIGSKVKCVVQSHLKIIRVLQNGPLTPFELLYILNQPSVQRQIRNLIFIQSTLGSLGSRINEMIIPIPEKTVEWRSKIAEFESVLRQRYSLLEKIKSFQVEEII